MNAPARFVWVSCLFLTACFDPEPLGTGMEGGETDIPALPTSTQTSAGPTSTTGQGATQDSSATAVDPQTGPGGDTSEATSTSTGFSSADDTTSAGEGACEGQPCEPGELVWQSTALDRAFFDVGFSPDGRLIAVGATAQNIDAPDGTSIGGEGGQNDIFFAELAPEDGALMTVSGFSPSPGSEFVVGFGIGEDGILTVSGVYFGEGGVGGDVLPAGGRDSLGAFVAQYGPNFEHLTSHSLLSEGGMSFLGPSAILGDRLFLAAGYTAGALLDGTALQTPTGSDVVLASFGSAGAPTTFYYSGGGNDSAIGPIAREADLILGGTFQQDLNIGNIPLQTTSQSVFVAAVNGAGLPTWAIRSEGTGEQTLDLIRVDAAGYLYLAGRHNGTIAFPGGATLPPQGDRNDNVFVAKLDPGGGLAWARSYGGPGSDRARGLAVRSDGNIVVSGEFAETFSAGNEVLETVGGALDAFVVHIDPQGQVVWARSGGGAGIDRGGPIAIDEDGFVYVNASYDEVAGFGGKAVVPKAHGFGQVLLKLAL